MLGIPGRSKFDEGYRRLAAEALASSDTPATVIHAIILSEYGYDFLYGEEAADPLEIWTSVEIDFRTEMSEESKNRLMAMIIAVSSDAMFESYEVLASVTLAFTLGDIGDVLEGLSGDIDLEDALLAVFEAYLNREQPAEFSDSVAGWFAEQMKQNAIEGGNIDEVMAESISRLKNDIKNGLLRLGADPEILDDYLGIDLNNVQNEKKGSTESCVAEKAAS